MHWGNTLAALQQHSGYADDMQVTWQAAAASLVEYTAGVKLHVHATAEAASVRTCLVQQVPDGCEAGGLKLLASVSIINALRLGIQPCACSTQEAISSTLSSCQVSNIRQ